MVIMGIVLVLMETIMVCAGFCWWDDKSYWKNAQNTIENEFCNVLLEKANGL